MSRCFVLASSLVTLLLSFHFVPGNGQSIDSSALLASNYFREAKDLSEKDNGKLWGLPLYGPMLFVNPKTGEAFANEMDSAGSFKKSAAIFTGSVPKTMASNTGKYWGGKYWTVILWPLPADRTDRANLLMHELFHQAQLKTRMPAYSPACDHLDRYEGRLLLQLELEALRTAINQYPAFHLSDLANAVALRHYRYSLYSSADSLEHALEFNEGLATYTGFVLADMPDPVQKTYINRQLEQFYSNKTFTRSLGYITGCLYGYLLNRKNPGWTKNLVAKRNKVPVLRLDDFRNYASFDKLLTALFHLKIPPADSTLLQKLATADLYHYKSIYLAELQRETNRLTLEAANRKKFVEGPVLELPNDQLSFNFNPNEVQVLEGVGPIYPSFTGTASWGVLQVSKGGVLIKDWMKVYVPLPEGFDSQQRLIKMSDWQLELKEGWTIIPGTRKGDYIVSKQQ